ncbi:acyl-CoA synthetase [Variovorax paradoxus]|uniref:AMP-binding protein n=1 Tax=Comamonadaceae TaxID=80864 RepID=UPI00056FC37F|nr:AMP-binding protein [Xenophilus azovorans]KPU99431.1 acyl-CoA synthetase [Variovorax paradoxus]MBN8746436.1 AMP-binding protein [Variovorax sp.]VTY37037.1 Long-chain-fatty-acid--CoA ligase FadD13 [Xylophilus ampelinus]KPV02161.1 acyl-CoA synthetase [Variovorax paradoxus]KPV08708.1 acyl-CoA synthetase [Variovorax paradoxus]
MVNLSAAILRWARAEPARPALLYRDQGLSYGDLAARIAATAASLRARGIGEGDIVALLMKNSAAFIELSLAVSHLGAVLLPINYRLGADEVAYIVGHAGVKLLLVDEELRALAGGFANVAVVDEAAQSDSRRIGPAAEPLAEPCVRQPHDLFRLMYTSGTTDRPKGVIHSYANYHWKCLDHIAVLGLHGNERLLVVGPLYHVGAFDLPGLAVLQMGGLLAVLREFDPEPTLALIEREKLTAAWMAPVMLNRLLALPDRARFDLSSLRWQIGGGERTPEERIREFRSLFPNGRYIDGYGLTESCSGDTLMEAGREIEKIGSTGRVLPHVELRVCDDDGRALPAGEAGEICLRGPKVTAGYWRDPDKTAASFHAGGWLRTGDVGYVDAEGFLFLTDRKKDMIISGGENIASSEVERVLYQLPQVLEAAAVGLPDAQWGERVAAVVVLRPGTTLALEELQAFCRGKLGGFKLPRQLVLRETLPRLPSGKVLKRVLRAELASEASGD